MPWAWERTTAFVDGHGALDADERDRLIAARAAVEDAFDVATAEAVAARADVAVGPVLRAAVDALDEPPNVAAVLRGWLRGEFENQYAAPVDELSLINRAEPYHLDGGDELITSGIDTFTAAVAADLDVRLGERVVALSSSADGWRAVTALGASFTAAAIVLTVPLPVLQRDLLAIDPPLPAEIDAALDRMACGPVAKVFATFDDAFWAPHRAFWVVAEERRAFELFVDVSAAAGRPALCAFASGRFAAEVESMTEDARCRLLDEILAGAHLAPEEVARHTSGMEAVARTSALESLRHQTPHLPLQCAPPCATSPPARRAPLPTESACTATVRTATTSLVSRLDRSRARSGRDTNDGQGVGRPPAAGIWAGVTRTATRQRGTRGEVALRVGCGAGVQPARAQPVPLRRQPRPPGERTAGRADQGAGDPAGVDRRVDRTEGRLAPAGHRARRPRPQAVPVPRRVPRRARVGQVRRPPPVRAGPRRRCAAPSSATSPSAA